MAAVLCRMFGVCVCGWTWISTFFFQLLLRKPKMPVFQHPKIPSTIFSVFYQRFQSRIQPLKNFNPPFFWPKTFQQINKISIQILFGFCRAKAFRLKNKHQNEYFTRWKSLSHKKSKFISRTKFKLNTKFSSFSGDSKILSFVISLTLVSRFGLSLSDAKMKTKSGKSSENFWKFIDSYRNFSLEIEMLSTNFCWCVTFRKQI